MVLCCSAQATTHDTVLREAVHSNLQGCFFIKLNRLQPTLSPDHNHNNASSSPRCLPPEILLLLQSRKSLSLNVNLAHSPSKGKEANKETRSEQRDQLVSEIALSLEHVLMNMNLLNRSLEGVIAVRAIPFSASSAAALQQVDELQLTE